MEVEYKECQGNHQNCVGSPYPKNKVPVSLFRKNPDDTNSKTFRTCFHCRNYNTIKTRRYAVKKSRKIREIKAKLVSENSKFSYCSHSSHDTIVKFSIPRDKVPIESFLKYPDDPKSQVLDTCLECREFLKGKHEISKDDYIFSAKLEGLFWCPGCRKNIENEERCLNLDGTYGSLCTECKDRKIESNKKVSRNYLNLKLEFIKKYQCSCYICKCLYFRPENDSLCVTKIPTYEKEDGERYARLDGEEFSVKNIIDVRYEKLELSIIEFDHLTEEEQRERKMLLPDQKYVPKVDMVSKIRGKHAMKVESGKCQHLCAKCHINETIRREGIHKTVRTNGVTFEKINYVRLIKKDGCSSCGDVGGHYRFYDLDHLDPKSKRTEISRMVITSYSLEDVIEECKKCRVLCKHCHIIRTIRQIKLGLFLPTEENWLFFDAPECDRDSSF